MAPETGMTIRRNIPNSPQPSILAASSSSCGTFVWKKERATIIVYTVMPAGSISARRVFTTPRSRISRYEGIRPPPKYIVMRK